jgi:hypothetical protein
MAMRRLHQSGRAERLEQLEEAGRHYTLSLAYDQLFAPDFRDLRRGMERIYDSLKGLNRKEEFPALYRGVDGVTEKYKLPTPTRMHRFLEESFGPPAG